MARHHPILYEVNTHSWLAELSRSYEDLIRLGNVPEPELERWQDLGFTHIWMMGVWRTGPQGRTWALHNWTRFWSKEPANQTLNAENVISSPFAIMDYHVPDHLGGERGLQLFRSRLEKYEMKLVLDFVPNHLGVDHPWILARPDLFISSGIEHPGTFRPGAPASGRWFAHGKDPWFPPWTDTVQLDYRNPDTHAAMFQILRAVATRCDGVRCDMAMLLLPEIFDATWETFPAGRQSTRANFWESTIPGIKEQFADFSFIGEVYWDLEERMQRLGFDFTYDKRIYDYIVGRNPSALHQHLLNQTSLFLNRSVHFLENHDEPRISSLLSRAEHRAAAVLLLALPGMRLLHEGQLSGRRVFNRIQLRVRPAEEPDPIIEAFYDGLLTALKSSAIGRGQAHVLSFEPEETSEGCFVIQWQNRPESVDLVTVNLGTVSAKFKIILQGRFSSVERWETRHLFGDHLPVHFDPSNLTLRSELPPLGCQIFSLRAAD